MIDSFISRPLYCHCGQNKHNSVTYEFLRRFRREVPAEIIVFNEPEQKAQKQYEKINKAAVKDMDKDLAGYEKAIEKTDKVTKMPTNKFDYNQDSEKVYHDEMEIRNGQEMLNYDNEPSDTFTDRAIKAM